MRLELLNPPALVVVDDGGGLRPALLLARRADRSYVQLSRGAGRNHLCWVEAARVRPAPARPQQGPLPEAVVAGEVLAHRPPRLLPGGAGHPADGR